MPTQPVSLAVKEPSTLSKKSVKTEWHEKVLTISLASFPSKEDIEIDLIWVGHYEPVEGRLKGTGGKYKVVRIEMHEIKRRIFDYMILIILLIVPPMIGSWLDSRSAAPQQMSAPADSQRQPFAPASTKR